MEVWRELSPCRREQETGFCPARENRSSAWACTQKEPRACAAQMQTQTRCASCPPQVRVRARRGEETNPVRELLTAGVRLARRRRGLSACLGKQKPGGTHAPGINRVRARPGEGTSGADRFAGGRCTTSCIAGDEAACADGPAPGRRVRDLLTAGAGAVRGPAPGNSRGRARHGEERDTVRVLLTAGGEARG